MLSPIRRVKLDSPRPVEALADVQVHDLGQVVLTAPYACCEHRLGVDACQPHPYTEEIMASFAEEEPTIPPLGCAVAHQRPEFHFLNRSNSTYSS
jgi:hypothetical protein